MENNQAGTHPVQSTEEQQITRKADTVVLKKKELSAPQRTIRIDKRPEGEGSSNLGTALVDNHAQLTLEIEGHSEASVQVTIADQIVVGRASPNADEKPDLDLTPYHAAQLGVSRRHIMIAKEDNMLKVVDLGSTNGTCLNGVPLYTNQARILRIGDKLLLGQLVLNVVELS